MKMETTKIFLIKLYPCHSLFFAQKICELRGWNPGSDKYDETHEVMFKIWEGLRSKADKDNDGQVSRKPKITSF